MASGKEKRFGNYIMDTTIVYVITAIIHAMLDHFFGFNSPATVFVATLSSYYILLEYFTGQTIGKRLTKMHVVSMSGGKPTLKAIVLRTVLRINPLDWLSYLFGLEAGTHDYLSKTKVVPKVEV
jgi:uncharacterized RDD family membrane protein YckC